MTVDPSFWQQLPTGAAPDPTLVSRALAMALKVFPGAKLMPALRHDRRGRKCRECGVETLWCTRDRVHVHPVCAGY